MGGQNSYLPLKLNMSGVMPIIFASALVSIPGTIGLSLIHILRSLGREVTPLRNGRNQCSDLIC